MSLPSHAFDAVCAADHPTPENGGPCATCAFRPGTEAHRSEQTTELARLCVEGISPFDCHERPRLCRGWIAAVNLRHAAGEITDDVESTRYREAMRHGVDMLGRCIDAAVEADRAASRR